jgi:hypothetical protein
MEPDRVRSCEPPAEDGRRDRIIDFPFGQIQIFLSLGYGEQDGKYSMSNVAAKAALGSALCCFTITSAYYPTHFIGQFQIHNAEKYGK